MMKPLKVDFILKGEMATPTHPIHLDSLLAWASVRKSQIEGYASEENPYEAQDRLPLKSQGGVWCASMLNFEIISNPRLKYMTRKTDINQMAEMRKSGLLITKKNMPNLNSGPLKNFMFNFSVQDVSKATAYCIGNTKDIESLLSMIEFIGSKRRLGLGEVLSVKVEEDESAYSLWMKRIMDVPITPEHIPISANFRPPYFKKTNNVGYIHPDFI